MPYLQRAKEVHQVLEIIQWAKDFALEQKIVTIQFGGIDAFGGNPSFYDNGYNMSSTFYNRPPTKKFGTVQENP